MSTGTKARYARRERRKAKASGFRRLPKANPRKVGHGPNGLRGLSIMPPRKRRVRPLDPRAEKDRLRRLQIGGFAIGALYPGWETLCREVLTLPG